MEAAHPMFQVPDGLSDDERTQFIADAMAAKERRAWFADQWSQGNYATALWGVFSWSAGRFAEPGSGFDQMMSIAIAYAGPPSRIELRELIAEPTDPNTLAGPSRPVLPQRDIVALISLRQRQLELSFNAEQNATSLREGLAAARYEQATGRTVTRSNTEGVDINDPVIGPVSLKGPAGLTHTGKVIRITDEMVEGLAASVVKDVKFNTATKSVAVDTFGLSAAQRQTLEKSINAGVGPSPGKSIVFLE